MALSGAILDRERDKFVEDPNTDTAVRVVVTATIPSAPAMTSATPGNQQNTIIWEAVAGATDYIVVFDTTAGVTSSDTQIITGSTSTTYLHTGLSNGTTYYYKVIAVGAWGNTAVSANEVSATPEAYTNALSTLLDGVDEYITFGDNHNYEINVAFSLSLWIKPTNLAGSRKTIWAKASNDAQVDGWGWYLETSGELFLQARTTTVNRQHTTTTAGLTAGTWYHLVMTYDGGSNLNGVTFYVDGTALTNPSSQTLSGTIITTDPSQFGRRNTAFPLNANLDEITFWGVELSGTEVTELYNSGTPDDPNNHSQVANLQHWYKMGDGDTFPTISDNEASVDGTMTNMESGDFVSDTP